VPSDVEGAHWVQADSRPVTSLGSEPRVTGDLDLSWRREMVLSRVERVSGSTWLSARSGTPVAVSVACS
jgi:hypothetical protein